MKYKVKLSKEKYVNPLSANPVVDDLFECVWPFVAFGLKGQNEKTSISPRI